MAQPQGLNVPAIAVTGIVTVLLTAVIVEGVRAYYNYELPLEEARKWETIKQTTVNNLRDEQEKNIMDNTSLPIDQAMAKVAATGGQGGSGKMSATMASTRPNG